MTVEREEPDMLVATCDRCGDRVVLDLHVDVPEDEYADALDEKGWVRRKPDRIKFSNAVGFGGKRVIAFPQDFCGDCQTDEPHPVPRVGSGRRARPARDAFDNDPCDEWPRALVFEAIGLRRECGHPKNTDPKCQWCEAGYAIGDTRRDWQRK